MKYLFFIGSLLCLCATTVSAEEISFNRNLIQGDTGLDVLELQKILNKNPQTQITSVGPGSPGNETSYFGGLTTKAVIKFQELYAQETLAPAGLVQGTGFVGPLTRKKLQAFTQTLPISSISTPITSTITSTVDLPMKKMDKVALQRGFNQGVAPIEQALGTVEVGAVMIIGTSHEFIKPGDTLLITGYGFKPQNSVFIGSQEIKNVPATTTDTILVKIPEMKRGTYKLSVSNSQGSSAKKTTQYVTVASETKKRPVLTSSSPTLVGINDTITVKGVGFDASNNEIHSVLGTIKNVSSSNGTITFKVKDFEQIKYLKDTAILQGFPAYFRVETSSGLSENFGHFVFNGK